MLSGWAMLWVTWLAKAMLLEMRLVLAWLWGLPWPLAKPSRWVTP